MASLTAPPIGTPLSSGPPSLVGSPTLKPKSVASGAIIDEPDDSGAIGASSPQAEDDAAVASTAPSVKVEAEVEEEREAPTLAPMEANAVSDVGVTEEGVKVELKQEEEVEMKKSEDMKAEESQDEEDGSLEGLLGTEDEEVKKIRIQLRIDSRNMSHLFIDFSYCDQLPSQTSLTLT